MIDINDWIDIPDYPNYKIKINSNEIKSLNFKNTWNSNILKPEIIKWWYIRYVLYPFKKHLMVHQIVTRIKYWYWTPQWLVICHNNGDPTDNNPQNLRYWTYSDNQQDSKKHWTNYNIWRFWLLHCKSVAVLQYTKDWKFIREWDSISDIKRIWNMCSKNIASCCKWRRKYSNWFIWKYKN